MGDKTILHAGIAPATRIAGFEPLFHFWKGASGRRYLFTESGADGIGFFRDVVVLIAERDAAGDMIGRMVFVVESHEARAELLRLLAEDRRRVAFVHFIAATPAARREVAADLLSVPVAEAA